MEPLSLPKSCSPRPCQLRMCLAAEQRSSSKRIFPPYTLSILLWPRVRLRCHRPEMSRWCEKEDLYSWSKPCSPVACWLTSAACRTDWVLKLGAVERCCICCLVRVNIMVCWPGVALLKGHIGHTEAHSSIFYSHKDTSDIHTVLLLEEHGSVWRSKESSSSWSQVEVNSKLNHVESPCAVIASPTQPHLSGTLKHSHMLVVHYQPDRNVSWRKIQIPQPFPACTSRQGFSLLHLRSASFSGSFICSLPLAQPRVLRNHLCTRHCSTCVRCVFMQARRLASPSHGPVQFLLWQTDSLKRVIHTPWSRPSPTSLCAGTDKSAGLPNQILLQGLVLCHVLTSHFGLPVSHGWLLAYRSWCVL